MPNLRIVTGLLQDKQRDLQRQVRDRESIQVEKLADPLDVSTAQSARDTAGANINRAGLMLKEVRAALQRVEQGDYGICVDCDEDIPEKRLGVVPWAARCIPCQEAKDAEGKNEGRPRKLVNKRVTVDELLDVQERVQGRRGQ